MARSDSDDGDSPRLALDQQACAVDGVNGQVEGRQTGPKGHALTLRGRAVHEPVFVDGERTVTLKGERIAEEFQSIVDAYVRRRYAVNPVADAGGAQHTGVAPIQIQR